MSLNMHATNTKSNYFRGKNQLGNLLKKLRLQLAKKSSEPECASTMETTSTVVSTSFKKNSVPERKGTISSKQGMNSWLLRNEHLTQVSKKRKRELKDSRRFIP